MKEIIKQNLAAVNLPFVNSAWRRGVDFNNDIALTCPRTKVQTIFDVGAHVGEESKRFLKTWPESMVYAFEPAPETHLILKNRIKSNRFRLFSIAMSSTESSVDFISNSADSSNRIVKSSCADGLSYIKQDYIRVNTTTIDNFCHTYDIKVIDILKIDTEGHELHVLEGASKMLTSGSIGFIRVECGVDPNNSRHASFLKLIDFMKPFNYKIFGVYEQENEFFLREPQLRRFDLAFVSPSQIIINRGFAIRKPTTLLDIVVKLKHQFLRLLGKNFLR